jgi:3-methyladenine DNA glycosylase/8-oxoguanine DNA glycosylase
MKIFLKNPFHFEGAVKDHGWWMLAPNHWNEERNLYSRTIKLSNQKNVAVSISYHDTHLKVNVENNISLSEDDKEEIKQHITWIFRLEENFEAFYTMAQEHEELLRLQEEKRGRLLRSPTLFEDVTKVILTTNTSWQQTMNMANNLVEGLGETILTKDEHKLKTFPSAKKVLEAGEDYLKEQVRVGYRSSYLIDVAQKTLDPSFDLESFKNPEKDLGEIKTIKGIGPYAYSTLSMLLGQYKTLPIDSVYRERVTNRYFDGVKPSKKKLESVYDKWEDYKHLAYWFDR